MKRIMTALVATTAFAASPAIADKHMEKHGDMDTNAEMSGEKKTSADMNADAYIEKSTTDVPETGLDTRQASQAFLAMDTENDGLITKSEWKAWQNKSDGNTDVFADYDTDSDGDIELSEYLDNYDQS